MKKRTKFLAAVLSCAAIAGASVFGTMAYLTDTDTVTNTFTVGKVDISLDEAKTNADGDLLDTEEKVYTGADGQTLADRVKENSYKLIPGHTYVKDPVVHVEEDSEASYLFIEVKDDLANAETNVTDTKSINEQILTNNWVMLTYTGDDQAPTNTTVYYKKIAAYDAAEVSTQSYATFQNFKIKADLTNDELNNYADAQVVVKAYAIQSDGLADVNAAAAALGLSWGTKA